MDELRSDVNKILKQQQQHHNNQCNLNPSQCRALTQLKQDNTWVVLTVDKGVVMVIMDQEDYTKPKPYYKTPTPTKHSQRIPPANLKTNSSPQVHFKGGLTIKNLLVAPKDKDNILKKVESYIDIAVIGWSVMRSILGNQQEPLLKGSRNIKRLPPPYVIIPSDQVMNSTLTTLA